MTKTLSNLCISFQLLCLEGADWFTTCLWFRRSFAYTRLLLHEEVMPIVLLARLPVLEEPLGLRAPRLSYINGFSYSYRFCDF